MNNESNNIFDNINDKIFSMLIAAVQLRGWKLVVMTLLLPPIGTLIALRSKDVPIYAKLAAIGYTLLISLLLVCDESACASTAVISASDIAV